MALALLIGQILLALGPTVAQAYQVIAKKLEDGVPLKQEEWDVFWNLAHREWKDMKPEEAAKPPGPMGIPAPMGGE